MSLNVRMRCGVNWRNLAGSQPCCLGSNQDKISRRSSSPVDNNFIIRVNTRETKQKAISHDTMTGYYSKYFPIDIRTKLEAGSFRAVCNHLRDRSDAVQNIDLMTISGFCRNCLCSELTMQLTPVVHSVHFLNEIPPHWLVMAARKHSSQFPQFAEILGIFGYDEAAEEVYGCNYPDWKKRYAKKTTEIQMERYNKSVNIHASHDKGLLKRLEGSLSLDDNSKFFRKKIPEDVQLLLEAEAFRSLCVHLQERSNSVQNIDLMAVGGFCRNCLAKWLVFEARKISNELKSNSCHIHDQKHIILALNAFSYDEGAEEVYGRAYVDWKKEHFKKASTEQMENYNSTIPIHAIHDGDILKARAKKETIHETSHEQWLSNQNKMSSQPILSDVCCQDIETITAKNIEPTFTGNSTASPLCLPLPEKDISLRIGILTISDRAAAGEYISGDKSGPSVKNALFESVRILNSTKNSCGSVDCVLSQQSIVPDVMQDIKQILLKWSCTNSEAHERTNSTVCDIIFTTGGTGYSPRDITPEATMSVVDRECVGLMAWVYAECSLRQPLAILSRGTAGICGRTMIVNLPGNPEGTKQVIQILFPLLLHAIIDIQS